MNDRFCTHCGTQLVKFEDNAGKYFDFQESNNFRGMTEKTISYQTYDWKPLKNYFIMALKCPKYHKFFRRKHSHFSIGGPYFKPPHDHL